MSSKPYEFKPTYKQELFLSLPWSVKEGFYAGAVAAGKTDILLIYPAINRWFENPRFKGLFLRRTFPELKNEVIPRSRDYFQPLGGKFNKNDHVWEFESGALLFFGHCENEDDVHKYDSMQPNYVAFDELTSFTEWQYLYITLQRVRKSLHDIDLPAIVRSASNPGNIGHNWVRKRFIDPCPEGLKIVQGPSGIKRIFIPATIDDNPHVDPVYRKSLEALPEAEKQAKLYGNWSAYEGQVFEEFRERHYPDEPDNALHVIEPFDIPDYWPKIVAMDWGYAPPAMTWVGYGAVSPDKRLFIYREQAWQKTKIEEWAGHVRYFTDIEDPKLTRICKSASQNRGQEHTIQQQVSEALGRDVELSDNSAGSRVAGKMMLHEYLRWKQKFVPEKLIGIFNQEHAQWILRNKGMEAYEAYVLSFQPKNDLELIPKLQIFNTCKLLIGSIKSCFYSKTNPEDVAEFPGDDPYDGIRYLISAADQFFAESSNLFKQVQKRDEMLKEFNEHADINRFYQKARLLDNSQAAGFNVIRKFHGSRHV